MARQSFSYTHGDTGTAPSSSLNFEKNERPKAGHFDWYWYKVTEAISGHATEFDRLDSDDDGIVDEADEADTLDGEHASAFADAGHTHDGRYYTESEVDSNFNNYQDADARSAINNDGDHGSTASHNYFSGSHNDLSNVGADDHFNHATVAGSGSYNDLSNRSHGNEDHDSNFTTLIEVNNNADVPNADYADNAGDADTVDGNHASDLGGVWTKVGDLTGSGSQNHTYNFSNTHQEVKLVVNEIRNTSGSGQRVGMLINGITNGNYYIVSATNTTANETSLFLVDNNSFGDGDHMNGSINITGQWTKWPTAHGNLGGTDQVNRLMLHGTYQASVASPLDSITIKGVNGQISVDIEVYAR